MTLNLSFEVYIFKYLFSKHKRIVMMDYIPLQPTRDTDQNQQQKLAKKIKNFIYDPSDVIGSGFSSKVYKGINEQNNQQVAIKVIELSKIQNQVEKYLLNNEINALRALNHKNVLKTIDILMTKNNVYIVTEFCQFGDLQHMIKNNKKLQEKDALNIIKDIIQGYMMIEQKNIIHRDLKAANIFLTKTGAKIADFGFCQIIGERKPQIAYNVGSPAYMSPQSYKQNLYTPKSDIWAIGIIFYEMLMGQTPEKTLTYTEMSNNLMNGKLNCGSNQEIKQILLSCFKKDLKQRTDTKALLERINNAIEKITSNRNDAKVSNLPNQENGFSKNNSQVIPSQHRVIGQFSGQHQNSRKTGQNNRFASNSPSKLNKPIMRSQVQEPNKHFSLVPPHSTDQGNRQNMTKKEIVHSSGLIQVIPNASQTTEQSRRIKSSIIMLQFVFRIFKYLGDVSIPTISFLKLFTFRHRSHIDQTVENLLQDGQKQLKNSQIYKQFQFLKIKFDQAYLDKENGSRFQQHHELMNTLNKLANLSFIDSQCIKAYRQLIKKGCLEIQFQINQNRSNAFVLWDYLMLEYEVLSLYGQGLNDASIVNQKLLLEAILKQQPRNLSKVHIQLLKIKSKHLFDSQKMENIDIFKPGNNAFQPKFLGKGSF